MKKMFTFLMLVIQLLASDYSYTQLQMKELASSYVNVINNKLSLNSLNQSFFLKASEFRGYIASVLDSSKDFNTCIDKLTLNQVTYRTAVIISSSTNTSAVVPINILVAVQLVCKK